MAEIHQTPDQAHAWLLQDSWWQSGQYWSCTLINIVIDAVSALVAQSKLCNQMTENSKAKSEDLDATGGSFFNWNSFHARLNNHYETWSYKKKIKACRKAV